MIRPNPHRILDRIKWKPGVFLGGHLFMDGTKTEFGWWNAFQDVNPQKADEVVFWTTLCIANMLKGPK